MYLHLSQKFRLQCIIKPVESAKMVIGELRGNYQIAFCCRDSTMYFYV